MAYTKPPFNNIPFEFTPGGYSKPDFNNVTFRFGRPVFSQTANLQAAINVIGVTGTKDLGAFIKPTIQESKNLGAYTKSLVQASKNLGARVNVFQIGTKDLNAVLTGEFFKSSANLPAYIYSIPPVNLGALIKGQAIETEKDLPAQLHGWDQKDLTSYLKTAVREHKNLGAYVYGRVIGIDLSASVNIVSTKDLIGCINGFQVSSRDLAAVIYGVLVSNLPASIAGFRGIQIPTNLPAYLNGVYGPYDIQASLTAIPPKDLSAYIQGFKGIKIPIDLRAVIESFATKDLSATISLIEAVNLGAYINSTGKSDLLYASIIPNVVRLKRAIQISLLEHKDLRAVVNFSCFGSGYKDLGGYLYTIYKHDLKGYITGWYSGGTADTIRDLKAYINTAIYDVEDRIPIRYVPEVSKYTLLDVRFSVIDKYYVFDTFPIYYGNYYWKNLSASIYGMLRSVDLSASLNPIFDDNYSELPRYILPKSHEVVVNLRHLEEQWVRFVEIMFDSRSSDPFHYFYVSGSNKVYRVDKNRHWIIWAKSYIEDDDTIIDRRNVRFKYIFRMSDYSSIDEAVRDLIDRVSAYRESNLSASVTGIVPPYTNLGAYIASAGLNYRWVKHLSASITGVT